MSPNDKRQLDITKKPAGEPPSVVAREPVAIAPPPATLPKANTPDKQSRQDRNGSGVDSIQTPREAQIAPPFLVAGVCLITLVIAGFLYYLFVLRM